MRLTELLAELDVLSVGGDPAPVRIRGVCCHSTDVGPGILFVCIRGQKHDGHRFIEEALARGAAALVLETDAPVDGALRPGARRPEVPVIRVENSRQAYARLCAARAGNPSRRLHVTGVTGTNGKTTTAFFIDAVARKAGFKTGVVTTVFTRVGDDARPQKLTTPEAGELQATLAEMVNASVERVALEASSHALSMHRTTGVTLQAAVFTNLTRDHLDYHRDRNEYLRAKARLFHLLDETSGIAVINGDDGGGRRLLSAFRKTRGKPRSGPPDGAPKSEDIPRPRRIVTFAFRRPADVQGRLLPPGFGGTRGADEGRNGRGNGSFPPSPLPFHLHIVTPSGAMTIPLPPPGPAHAGNALAAAAAAWAQGIPLAAIAQGLTAAPLPPGRFQDVRCGQPFRVVVDFAHNPTGLSHALTSLRSEVVGRLHLVFGCKGDDGDDGKRRLMGRIAARGADSVVITTDNPFHECPRRIAEIVLQGASSARRPAVHCRIVLDRTEAIWTALARARPGDGVLIAGRGHEGTQRFGDEVIAFDDASVAARWLRARFAPAFV